MSNAPSPAAVRTRADVLPGHLLTAPPLAVLPIIEEELNRRFELRWIDIRVRSGAMAFDEAAGKAAAVVAETRPLRPYGENFDQAVCTDRTLTGLLLWACLRMHHRSLTLAQAEDILVEHSASYFQIRSAVLDLLGYGASKKDEAVAAGAATPATAST